MTATIRSAAPADAAAIGALHVTSWRETYAGLVLEAVLAALSIEERTAMWHGVLSAPEQPGRVAVVVAVDGDALVGFGACGRQRDEGLLGKGFSGEIGALYLLRSHQGRGIGHALLKTMAGLLIADGHGGASAWVLRGNGPARAFYRTLGAVVVGAKEGGGLSEDALGWPDLGLLLA